MIDLMGRRGRRVAARGVGRARDKSRDSEFAEAYDEHVWHVYGYFAYRLPSRADAEDLTQLTFERALKAWDRFDAGRASVATWLLAIARNLLVDHFRRDRSHRHEPLDDGNGEATMLRAPDDPPALGVSPELALGLERLGQREREVIALRFGGDLTGPEIAELTGLSVVNVQQILSRSLRRLRAELERTGPPMKKRIPG